MTTEESLKILHAIKCESELPIEVRWKRLVESGAIDEDGRVILRCPDAEMNTDEGALNIKEPHSNTDIDTGNLDASVEDIAKVQP